MEDNRILYLAEEAIINLLLHSDVSSVINFFEAYPNYNYLLDDKYFLHELSIINDIPDLSYVNAKLDKLIKYSKMSFEERLGVAVDNGDIDGVKRMLYLVSRLPNLETDFDSYISRIIEEIVVHKKSPEILEIILEHINNFSDKQYSDWLNYVGTGKYTNTVKILLKYITNPNIKTLNHIMSNAAYFNNIELINLMLKYGASDYNGSVFGAIRGNHINIIELMLDLGTEGVAERVNDYNGFMKEAATHNNIDIVRLMLKYGANNYNDVMAAASSVGTTNIVRLMLDLGADNYNESIQNAVLNKHIDIIRLMLEHAIDISVINIRKLILFVFDNKYRYKHDTDVDRDIIKLLISYDIKNITGQTLNYNEIMYEAVEYSRIDIIKLMLDLGANNYNEVMYEAAEKGYIDIVQLMLKYNANDYNTTMLYAVDGNHMNIIKLMLDLGANNYNEVMIKASQYGYIEIVKLMVELGASDFNEAIIIMNKYPLGPETSRRRVLLYLTHLSRTRG